MSESLVGYRVGSDMAEAIKMAVEAGFQDWNKTVGLNSSHEATVGRWTHVVVDDEGDVLLGMGAKVIVDSLGEWENAIGLVAILQR